MDCSTDYFTSFFTFGISGLLDRDAIMTRQICPTFANFKFNCTDIAVVSERTVVWILQWALDTCRSDTSVRWLGY